MTAVKGLWHSLRVTPAELRLDTTLNCGQSFRWRATGESQWTNVLGEPPTIVSLRQTEFDVEFQAQGPSAPDAVRDMLRDYFQLEVDLKALYTRWNTDPNFKKKAGAFNGIRILRQDPTENLFTFICSSNNNISRIALMVRRMSERYGALVGTLHGTRYHAFPTVSSLAADGVEETLKELGFGYRAKYIARTARHILEHHDENWLASLREVSYTECKEELLKLSGVGPKVADCVCLMSMDKHGAIPVDVHMWQIAKRDYKITGLAAAKTITPATYLAIGNFFRDVFGEYAGWMHSVLFTADLRKFEKRLVTSSETIATYLKVEQIKEEEGSQREIVTTQIKVEETNAVRIVGNVSPKPMGGLDAFPRRKVRHTGDADVKVKLQESDAAESARAIRAAKRRKLD
ncbi:8-oxoguanine glycosylase ogg1 [Thoreauomyces humboldtii]|nr:8-oxoguanine glycosylase ogg1 [Thoreauomyces humboldtii]